jgi:orotidine-5'-phosphate decarboxylase
MNYTQLVEQIFSKKTYLCVGLDTDFSKLPKHLQQQPNAIVEFNKAIIDATKNYCVSYKINTAFYEARGVQGWKEMEETVAYIPSTHFTIADAKRADIGNTSAQYAKAFFETLNFDAITVSPYMGHDSLEAFLNYKNKFTIVLGLTSNSGAADFELQTLENGKRVYEQVLHTVSKMGSSENCMFVVGATQAHELEQIRKIIPQHFLLVPGVGFQGGSLADTSKYGLNNNCGLLVNASRAIIYAGAGENFAEEAAAIAQQYQAEMQECLAQFISA